MSGNTAALQRHFSEGASGSFFFFSIDRRYMLKTLTAHESRLLRRMLPDYKRHMCSQTCSQTCSQAGAAAATAQTQRSLLCRFYGLYSITLYGHCEELVVMNNFLLTPAPARAPAPSAAAATAMSAPRCATVSVNNNSNSNSLHVNVTNANPTTTTTTTTTATANEADAAAAAAAAVTAAAVHVKVGVNVSVGEEEVEEAEQDDMTMCEERVYTIDERYDLKGSSLSRHAHVQRYEPTQHTHAPTA